MNSNVKAFFEKYDSDPALRARVQNAEDLYPGSLEIREALVGAVLLPIAEEMGLGFTIEQLRDYEEELWNARHRDVELTEEEQVAIYRRIAEGMGTKNVVLRTLDVGGDKMLPYHSHVHETNPFLGLRAIRFTLRNPGIFTQQIRAMLRAGHNHPLHIMFPFISSVDEFTEASDLVRQCVKDLHHEGLPCNAHPKLGCMVELPAAVEIIDELGHDCDFLSIGSNDLIQYLLAVDRTNERVSSLYVPYHPAVLRALKRIAEGAARQQVDLSLCGDMALDARMLPFLLGVGIRKLSVDPRSIFRLQKKIQAIDSREAETIAGEMLAIGRLAEMEDYLRAHGLMAEKKSG